MTISIEKYEKKVITLTTSINALQEELDELNNEKDEIDNYVLSLKNEMDEHLQDLADDLTNDGYCQGTCTICTSGDYGNGNLYEWAIVYGISCSTDVAVYEYTNITSPISDSLKDNIQKIASKYAAVYDHLKHKINTNGTYGIESNIINITIALNIQQTDKTRLENLINIYSGDDSSTDAYFETEQV